MKAATVLCQSKNIYQTEIDEVVDFCRLNVHYMQQIYSVSDYAV